MTAPKPIDIDMLVACPECGGERLMNPTTVMYAHTSHCPVRTAIERAHGRRPLDFPRPMGAPPVESALERFERLAAEFYRETGLMAPGKDDALGHHSYEERVERWAAWVARRSAAVAPAPVPAAPAPALDLENLANVLLEVRCALEEAATAEDGLDAGEAARVLKLVAGVERQLARAFPYGGKSC